MLRHQFKQRLFSPPASAALLNRPLMTSEEWRGS